MKKDSPSVRERILEAAVSLLREHGVKKLAQPQVARAAGIPQGHLTYYFPHKLDLLAAVVERFAQMSVADLRAFAEEHTWSAAEPSAQGSALAKVASLVRDRARTRMLLGLVVESDSHPALRAAMERNALFMRGMLAQVMERPPEHPDVNLMLAAMWGIGLHYLLLGDRENESGPDGLVARLTRLIDLMRTTEQRRDEGEEQ